MTTTVEGMTILKWLSNAGITEERARMHLREGRVFADDVLVTDPSALVDGARIYLRIPRADDDS